MHSSPLACGHPMDWQLRPVKKLFGIALHCTHYAESLRQVIKQKLSIISNIIQTEGCWAIMYPILLKPIPKAISATSRLKADCIAEFSPKACSVSDPLACAHSR